VEEDNAAFYEAVRLLNKTPVTIEEFLESTEFLGDQIEIWPSLLPDLWRINPDVLTGEEPVHEVLLGGATGTGKTTLATVTALYQIYLLTCFDEPQRLFKLAPNTPIIFVFQSVTPAVTQRVIYSPFRRTFEAMPYARHHLEWDRHLKSSLKLEGGITVVQEVANIQAIAGQAIAGGILDEVNFMNVVERSKRVPGPRGLGGRYDQAEELYRNHSRRRKSRFITQGLSLGTLCVLSSTRYEGDFLDRRIAEVDRLDEQNVVVVRHKQFEVVPPERFCGETFRLLVGTDRYGTRVLADDETPPDGAQVEQVPVEYKVDFLRDPENALRDICGIATSAIQPFIGQRHKIVDAILAGRELGLRQWVDKADVDLAIDGPPQWNADAMPDDRDRPRFAHVDLSLNRDRCGIAIVKWAGMVSVPDSQEPECVEVLPQFIVETAMTIRPSPSAELDFGDLRSWLTQMKTFYDFNLKQISFDGYQSRESIQALRKAGIWARERSVDRTTEPYDHLRRALYQDRVAIVESETLLRELSQLEINEEKGKIDHPPRGSKDLADSVAAAVFAASQDRRTRSDTGPVDREGERPRARTVERRQGGGRRRDIVRSPGKARGRPNRTQQMHDFYREQRQKEEEEFKKRYG
jgi:hypothetical protein